MHHFTRNFHRLATGAVTSLLIAALVVSLAQAVGVFRLVPVLSGSMTGFVEAGDAAVLRPVDVSQLRRGDVLAFHPPLPRAPLTLHRIVHLDRTEGATLVRTAGDANAAADPWRARLAEGRAWRANGIVLQGAGQWVMQLQRPAVRLVLLAVVLGVLLLAVLRRIWHPAETGPGGHRGPGRQNVGTVAIVGALVVVLGAALHAMGGTAASASLTTSVTASHTVSTFSVSPPSDPAASLVCDLGVPTAVRVTWSASASEAVSAYLIERGSAADGPFAAIARTGGTEYDDDAVAAVLAGETWYRVRGVVGDRTTAATEPVDLLALCP